LFVKNNVASLIRQSALFDGTAIWVDVRTKGFVGRISGFKVIQTNNYATDGTDNFMVAMDRDSIHFVSQMVKMKITEGEAGFYHNLLWEMVYWGKVFTENSKRICTLKHTN
jgi:hypothetical protein